MEKEQPWTPEQIDMVEVLYARAYSHQRIAEEIGIQFGVWRSKEAVRSKRRDLGLVADRRNAVSWDKATKQKLREMYEAGATDKEIAKALDRTIPAIKARRKLMNLLREKPSRPPPEKKSKFSPWPADMPRFEDVPRAEQLKRDMACPLGVVTGPWPVSRR